MRRVWEQARARRRAETAETGTGDREAAREEPATPEVEALLAAVRRPAPRRGEESAQAALAAYREARDSGVHALPGRWWRARGRDDWRPSRRRRGALPVRAAFASAAATVTLGGMALAAGTGAIPGPFGTGGSGGSASGGGAGTGTAGTYSNAPTVPGTERGSAGDTAGGAARRPSADVTRPATARPPRARGDVEYCAAYLASDGRGTASRHGEPSELPTAAAAAAGQSVEAYCEDVLKAGKRPGPGPEPAGKSSPNASKALKPSKAPKSPKPTKSPKSTKPSKPTKAAEVPRTTEPPAQPTGGAPGRAKPAKPAHSGKPAKPGNPGNPAKPEKPVKPEGKSKPKSKPKSKGEGKGGDGHRSGNVAQRTDGNGPRKQ